MKVLRVFNSRIEAEIVKSLLEAHGIQAQIRADDQGGLRPELTLTNGVRVLVREEDHEQANKLLARSNLRIV